MKKVLTDKYIFLTHYTFIPNSGTWHLVEISYPSHINGMGARQWMEKLLWMLGGIKTVVLFPPHWLTQWPTHWLTHWPPIDCVITKKIKYVLRYAVLAGCTKYKYLKGFVISSNLNLAWLTNSKWVIRYAQKINLKYLICLLFFTYLSANSKFGIGFAVPINLVTYLSNVEGFLYVLWAPQKGPCLWCQFWIWDLVS